MSETLDESSEDDAADNPHTEEGMMKAFVTLHERRLHADATLKESGFSGDSASVMRIDDELLDGLVCTYDNICDHVLIVDGATNEDKVFFVGHAIEICHCRLASARIANFRAWNGLARQRSSEAVSACNAVLRKDSCSQQPFAVQLLRGMLVDALIFRARASLREGCFAAAREDAMLARSNSRCWHLDRDEETLELVVRCEMALHAGGPGDDGGGCIMTPEAACALEICYADAGRPVLPAEPANITPCGFGVNVLDDMD